MVMRKTDLKQNQMLLLFKQHKCWTMEDLRSSLYYSGRSTQRLLKKIGYYSSFTHNGKWYTLHDIPEFDRNGLWFHQGIGFSKCRNLNATIIFLIQNSANGLTANDLSKSLSMSCPPILKQMYKANKIDRIKTSGGFVYLAVDHNVKSRQLSDLTESMQRPSDTDTIMILVEFIRNPNRTFEQLSSNLKKKRVFCNAEVVRSLFISLGLEKKVPPKPK